MSDEDQNEYLNQMIWAKVEQIGCFDIYQEISEFVLQHHLFQNQILVATKSLTEEEYAAFENTLSSREIAPTNVKLNIEGEGKTLPETGLEGLVFYSVAPYLKRYLKQFEQRHYSCGNFLVWGRKGPEPLNRCRILHAVVTERLSRKLTGQKA